MLLRENSCTHVQIVFNCDRTSGYQLSRFKKHIYIKSDVSKLRQTFLHFFKVFPENRIAEFIVNIVNVKNSVARFVPLYTSWPSIIK